MTKRKQMSTVARQEFETKLNERLAKPIYEGAMIQRWFSDWLEDGTIVLRATQDTTVEEVMVGLTQQFESHVQSQLENPVVRHELDRMFGRLEADVGMALLDERPSEIEHDYDHLFRRLGDREHLAHAAS